MHRPDMTHSAHEANYRPVGVVLLLVAMPVCLLALSLATLKAFGLFGTTAKATGAGDISADQANLAVALLVDLWSQSDGSEPQGPGDAPAVYSNNDRGPISGPAGPSGKTVSTEVAVLILDAALRSEVPSAQLVAAELLYRNAWRLDASKSLRLYGISSGDPCARVKGCIATLLRALLPALVGLGYEDFMEGSQTVTLSQLKAAANIQGEHADGMLERALAKDARHLAEWSKSASRSASPTQTVPAAA